MPRHRHILGLAAYVRAKVLYHYTLSYKLETSLAHLLPLSHIFGRSTASLAWAGLGFRQETYVAQESRPFHVELHGSSLQAPAGIRVYVCQYRTGVSAHPTLFFVLLTRNPTSRHRMATLAAELPGTQSLERPTLNRDSPFVDLS